LVAGSRTVEGKSEFVHARLSAEYAKNGGVWSSVLSGGARGADTYGETWAYANGLQVIRMLPDWATHGRAAGVMRNTDLVLHADYAIVFWDGVSKGTLDTITKLQKAGKPHVVIRLPET